jgi:hypothetical protein
MTVSRGITTVLIFSLVIAGCGFAGAAPAWSEPPGFVVGVWHGLLAPYTLVIRFFLDIHMYAVPNSGWFYDCGFLIGVGASLPIGWLAALLQLGLHFLA